MPSATGGSSGGLEPAATGGSVAATTGGIAATGGSVAATTGGTTGGIAETASGGKATGGASSSTGGSPVTPVTCAPLEAEYSSGLQEQIGCDPTLWRSQCAGRVAAGPGCDCKVFVEPKDPFAIEHLGNLQSEWFTAECSDADCPSSCASGSRGVCQPDPGFELGGRCVAAP